MHSLGSKQPWDFLRWGGNGREHGLSCPWCSERDVWREYQLGWPSSGLWNCVFNRFTVYDYDNYDRIHRRMLLLGCWDWMPGQWLLWPVKIQLRGILQWQVEVYRWNHRQLYCQCHNNPCHHDQDHCSDNRDDHDTSNDLDHWDSYVWARGWRGWPGLSRKHSNR